MAIRGDHDAGDETDALSGAGKNRHDRDLFEVMTVAGILLVRSIRIGGSDVSGNDDMIGDGDAEKTQLLSPLDEADQLFGLYCGVGDREVKSILHGLRCCALLVPRSLAPSLADT